MCKKSLLLCPWVMVGGLMAIAPYAQASEVPINPIIVDGNEEIITDSEREMEDITVTQKGIDAGFEFTQINADINFFWDATMKENGLVSQSASDLETEETSSANSWHFLVQPSIYVPFTIYGDAAAGSVNGDFSLDASQIRKSIKDDLNFAFFGRVKAWNPDYRLGFFADFDYLSSDNSASVTRTLPPSFGGIPITLNGEVDSTLWSLSLGGAYRFYDPSKVNPEGVETEFDLGRSVFDVFGGLNITGVDLGLNFSSPGLGRASFNGDTTVVSPIIGGRARVNLSPQWAWVTGGSVSGFGISGLTQWNLGTGVDWKFSEGKTSLGLGYRFGYTSYTSNLTRSTDFDVNVNQNGPYVNVSFRF
ncbi:hypothetical protein A5482_010700 [Cyanobacterium sp. IPPAS B-1200]|uniref:hypothetical protein n=1 Tax=Cyanobacterium sp. IPPAS B-1200 TaxID=1562720 RepID=UPI000852574D|nr:hypothetical protein [Cyanobacterium sp. IPPAS B-1200]OEJ79765.1 hypothetical protein A5482_09110 [Cyanobacterium sp. IPPAS B-1200]